MHGEHEPSMMDTSVTGDGEASELPRSVPAEKQAGELPPLDLGDLTPEARRALGAYYGAARDASHRESRRALARAGGVSKARKVLHRLVHEIGTAPDRSRPALACRAGCTWCCSLPVTAAAHEVFVVARAVRANSDGIDVERKIATAAAARRSLPDTKRARTRIVCPMLGDGRCLVYDARPSMFRSHHSTSAAACERSARATADDPGVPGDPLRHAMAVGVLEGHLSALQDAGFDAGHWDFVLALEEALEDESCERRFLACGTPFKRSRRVETLPPAGAAS